VANWVSGGGCINGIRFALDGIGAGSRDWIEAADTDAVANTGQVVIVAISVDSADMDTISGDFVLEWANDSDAGSWSDLDGTGELVWSSSSDLSNGATVTESEKQGTENCSGMGVTWEDGVEREGANDVTLTNITTKLVIEMHWAVDLSGADGTNQDEYEFRISESGGGSGVYKTFVSLLQVVKEGEITGTTKNSDRSSAVGGVTVTAFFSDDAGTDPKPLTTKVPAAQTVSHVSTGAYTLSSLASGQAYFLHFYKDDTDDLSDGSPEVTAVDV
jgi:hypothetical protein